MELSCISVPPPPPPFVSKTKKQNNPYLYVNHVFTYRYFRLESRHGYVIEFLVTDPCVLFINISAKTNHSKSDRLALCVQFAWSLRDSAESQNPSHRPYLVKHKTKCFCFSKHTGIYLAHPCNVQSLNVFETD